MSGEEFFDQIDNQRDQPVKVAKQGTENSTKDSVPNRKVSEHNFEYT